MLPPMLLYLAGPAAAQEVSGFAEVRGIGQIGVDGVPYNLIERFRPTFDAPLGDRVSLSTTVEAQLVQGRRLQDEVERTIDESDVGPLLDVFGCAWPEPPRNQLLGIDGIADWLTIERLYLDAYLPQADIRVGRQAVQWGSALLVNPTDPFPEVLFTEPWRFRAGVNATRVTVPLGDHQAQLFLGADDAFTAVRAAGRATVRAAGTDFSVVAAHRGETGEELVGIDVRGTLGVGFWGEAALHVPEGTEVWEEVALGVDYSFPVMELLVVAAQYYRRGAGSAEVDPLGAVGTLASAVEPPQCSGGDPELLAGLGLDPGAAVDPYASPFRGRDYGLVVVRAGIVEELSATLVVLQNVGHPV